jgi:hypothetical protein
MSRHLQVCLRMSLLPFPLLQIQLPVLLKMKILLGTINEGRRLRSRVIQPNSEVANQVSYSCYLAQTEPKKLMKPYRMKVGCLPCMMSSINSLEMMFGPWFPVLQNKISLVLSEFSRIKQMSMALWFGIKPVLLPRDTLR